jgi:hypothetical protein
LNAQQAAEFIGAYMDVRGIERAGKFTNLPTFPDEFTKPQENLR